MGVNFGFDLEMKNKIGDLRFSVWSSLNNGINIIANATINNEAPLSATADLEEDFAMVACG